MAFTLCTLPHCDSPIPPERLTNGRTKYCSLACQQLAKKALDRKRLSTYGVCSYQLCTERVFHKGSQLCQGHYQQQWLGKELKPLRGSDHWLRWKLATNREIDATGCWLWTGHIDTGGYGVVPKQVSGSRSVHRVAYELYVGPIGSDSIHHKCANRRCFNPEHLERATQRENSLEMHERRALRARIEELERENAELRARKG